MEREAWQGTVQHFEADWWGDCTNTYGEETKQIAYAKVMGLDPGLWKGGDHWPVWDFSGLTVMDVGGGPSSMLLKSQFTYGYVIDPCPYPDWVTSRYAAHNIVHRREAAEDLLPQFETAQVDIALCYNVLQHTMDPERICREMRRVAKRVHLFEWVDIPAHPGHPHELRAKELAQWLGGYGQDVWVDERYNEIGKASKSTVRQHGWGGTFA